VTGDLTPHEPEGHYDAVIVGSGFGGSVMAHRLAEAGLKVCVLERGKAYPPGTFPRSPWETARNFWDPSEGLHGMWNVWSFRGLGGICASGLGGGSLVYSNVLIRKDASTFVDRDDAGEHWPIRREDLDPHYERHERMLQATPYPFEPDPSRRRPEREPYDRTYKTVAMKEAADELGIEWFLPKLAVSFSATPGGEPGLGLPIAGEAPNIHGRTRLTCVLCGECNVGCNYGAKTTLDLTYLSRAALDHGAEIRTRAEVKEFEPRAGGGYVVRYADHSQAVDGEKPSGPAPLHTLTADRLVLAAGVFGTTFLLLKNRAAFPGLSSRLGTAFCGNGDLLTLAVRAREEANGRRRPRILDSGYGPAITSTMRVPDSHEGGRGRGYYLQDGGHPQTVNWIAETSYQLAIIRRAIRLAKRLARLWLRLDRRSDIGRHISSYFTSDLSSSSMPLFSMGRDLPDGTMTLTDDGYLDIDWRRDSSEVYESIRRTGRAVAGALNAKYMDNPHLLLNRVVTVHPLGGCPMGESEREGVVDSYGRVFGHPGLVIADGSILPGPVGPNPSNTIAALAHRAAERLIADAR
jgi:cholesterol oxidase